MDSAGHPRSNHAAGPSTHGPPGQSARRRKGHRGGKKKRQRRKSFAVPQDDMAQESLQGDEPTPNRDDFYHGTNLSDASLDSEALLDHRDQQHFMKPRRASTLAPTSSSQILPSMSIASRLKTVFAGESAGEDEDEGAPLLSKSALQVQGSPGPSRGYGAASEQRPHRTLSRRESTMSAHVGRYSNPFLQSSDSYNVNYPPSVPGSPPLDAADRMNLSFGDVMLHDDLDMVDGSSRRRASDEDTMGPTTSGSGPQTASFERRKTIALQAEEDVCFPHEGMSELAEEDLRAHATGEPRLRTRRRRGKWPDLAILEEWSRLEIEGRSEERRAKKITEPQLINGRLRPVHKGWFRAEEDAPYRFTYFNEEFQSTIHSQTISELVQPGGSFRELFIPEPPLLSDSSDEEEEDERDSAAALHQMVSEYNGDSRVPTRQASLANPAAQSQTDGRRDGVASPTSDRKPTTSSRPSQSSGEGTVTDQKAPTGVRSPPQTAARDPKPPRYGERPVWWLDIYSPTEAEMKVLSKAFCIHPLTAEDIMVQEAREKVELFRHYYFVNYRSFDQDPNSADFLEPVNMYVVVFREGVLSFHFSMTPHPANVRRRIRQLRDYMMLSSDWISYAIIDDITDVFVPLIQNIEDEVDDIDDTILQLHSSSETIGKDTKRDGGGGGGGEKSEHGGEGTVSESASNMLRRVGDCRKKVMGLYRLLGNKADVIKGFAKRCNEHWEVAPRSEIGLYLGDIQDHIVTMTSNLGHYEKILARSHGNYLAQINIRMNERQEQTADVLGKLTVLGTIVLPMNIITGLWGMNVWVPGQEHEGDLKWFLVITAGLLLFGLACYLIAKRVYKIV